jgi:lysophospholipase L1-like esterase
VVTASLDGIEPGHYGPDGIHLSDSGMEFEAFRLEEVIEAQLAGSP